MTEIETPTETEAPTRRRRRQVDPDAQRYAAAVESMASDFRTIYDRQRDQAARGFPEFDPMTMKRIVFSPQGRGSTEAMVGGFRYVPEVHQVAQTLADARKEGADFWHPDRGWIVRGVKASVDFGDPFIFSRLAPGEQEA